VWDVFKREEKEEEEGAERGIKAASVKSYEN
jgi:hypothetical protein